MSALVFGPTWGVRVVAGAIGLPSGAAIDNAEALRAVGRDDDEERIAFAAQAVEASYGVRTRHWTHRVGTPPSADEESTVDLGVRALDDALALAGIGPGELAALLVATSTPARYTTSNASQVAGRIGAPCAAMDVRAGCAGGLFALAQAALLSSASQAPVAVVGAETFSKVIPHGRPDATVALGNLGAAVIVAPTTDRVGLLGAFACTDGALGKLIHTAGTLPPTHAQIDANAYCLEGDPVGLASEAPPRYREAIAGALARAGLTAADVDRFVVHPTSAPLMKAVVAESGVPSSRAWARAPHANVGAAGSLSALILAREEGFVGAGQRVLLAAVGGGLSWAAQVWQC